MFKKSFFSSILIIIIMLTFTSCFRTKNVYTPDRPVNPSPYNGEVLDVNNLYLRWADSFDSAHESKYRVYYSQNRDNFNDYFVVEYNHFPTLNLNEGVWFWKVAAVTKEGVVVSSPVWSFTVNGETLPQPVEDSEPLVDPSLLVSEVQDTSFRLSWTEYTDVQNPANEILYKVYLYKRNDNSVPRSTESMLRGNADYSISTTDTTHLFENMGSRTKYNFTIIAQNTLGNTAEVGTSDVMTGNRPPSSFSIISPLNNQTEVSTNVTLSWEESVDPDGDAVRYFVYLDTVKDTNRKVGPIEGITETSFSPLDLSEGKTYYWTIVAKDVNGAATQTYQNTFQTISKTVSFPATPTPVDNATEVNIENSLTLTWECDEDNATYDVYLGTRKSDLEKVSAGIVTKSFVINKELQPDKTYYWKVVTKKDGNTAFGSVWSFNTAELSKASIISAKTNTEGTQIEMGFDKLMSDPTGKHNLFKVNRQVADQDNSVRNAVVETTAIGIKPGDAKTYILTLGSVIYNGENLSISYNGENIKSISGGKLSTFANYPVTNKVPGEKPVCVSATTTTDMKHIEIGFDKAMQSPSGKKEQFGVLVNGFVNEVTDIQLKENSDSRIYVLTLKEAVGKNNQIHVSYTRGDVKAVNGAELETFVNRPVVNTAGILIVNKNVSWNYNRIGIAINDALNGDTIIVFPGVYEESFYFMGKAITLKSTYETDISAIENTIIDTQNQGLSIMIVDGEDRNTVLAGFTIRNGYTQSERAGGAVTIQNASPTIHHNIITNNKAINGGGILVLGGSPLIYDNEIKNNTTEIPDMYLSQSRKDYGEFGGGICFLSEPRYKSEKRSLPENEIEFKPVVYSNTIESNTAQNGAGIYVGEGYVILNCEGNEWIHFNSPDEQVSFVENTELNNNVYTNNVLTEIPRSEIPVDGKDIAWFEKNTTEGILTLRPSTSVERKEIIMNIDYVTGCDYRNGSITFTIPSGFTVSTNAVVKIGNSSPRNIKTEEIDEKTVEIYGITLTEGSTVTLTLEEQPVPTGLEEIASRNVSYTFQVSGDSDAKGRAWYESNTSSKDFISTPLSRCTDFRLKNGADYLTLITDSATEIEFKAEYAMNTTVASVTSVLKSIDNSIQSYTVISNNATLNSTDILPAESKLRVTSARGNYRDFRVYLGSYFLLVKLSGEKTGYDTLTEAIAALNTGETATVYVATDTINEKDILINGINLNIQPIDGFDREVTFKGNRDGRCFEIKNDSDLTLYDITITNYSADFGGAIKINKSVLNLNSSIISSNTATVYAGGGIYSESSTLIVNDSIFKYNKSNGNEGGGIFLLESDLDMSNSTITNNNSLCGGGISIFVNSSASIKKSHFSLNSSVLGGGIRMFYASATITDLVIDGNTSDSGGAIHSDNSTITVYNNRITNNKTKKGTLVLNNSNIFNSAEKKWKHFNSPAAPVDFVEDTDIDNNYYHGNESTDGSMIKDILWSQEAVTTEGTLTLRPQSGTERDNVILNMDYETGCEYHNGSVVFTIPTGFKISENTKVKIGENVQRNLTSGEFSGQTATITSITGATDTLITMTLEEQKIPTGLEEMISRNVGYTFKAYGDADGEDTAWISSDESSDIFTSINLSTCTDFRLKEGFDYLTLITDPTTEIQYDYATSIFTTAASITAALESIDGSAQDYSIRTSSLTLNPDDILPEEASLTVTSARGNTCEFRLFIETGDFRLLKNNGKESLHKTLKDAIKVLQEGETGTIFVATDTVNEKGITICSKEVTIHPNDGLNGITFMGDQTDRCLYITNAASVTLNNSTITNYMSFNGGGGAIFSDNSSLLNINSCTITNNTSTCGGGLYLLRGSKVSINDSMIASNTALNYGGGLSLSDNSGVNITNSTIAFNKTQGEGGGVILYEAYAHITNSAITFNTANTGAGFHLYNSKTCITNSKIASNIADYEGGGFYLNFTSSASLTDSNITSNTAYNGGGFIIYTSNTEIKDSMIASNTADSGGGFYMNYTSSASITNSTIAFNEASFYGGGFYIENISSIKTAGNVWNPLNIIMDANFSVDLNGKVHIPAIDTDSVHVKFNTASYGGSQLY